MNPVRLPPIPIENPVARDTLTSLTRASLRSWTHSTSCARVFSTTRPASDGEGWVGMVALGEREDTVGGERVVGECNEGDDLVESGVGGVRIPCLVRVPTQNS